MKIHTKKLKAMLQIAKAAGDAKATLPIFGAVKLYASGDKFTMIATDGKRRVVMQVPCEGRLPEMCLPMKTLAATLDAKAAEAVEIDADGSKAAVKVGGRKFALSTLEAQDFPATPIWTATDSAKLPTLALADALAYCLPAVSADFTRENLCNVFVCDGRLAATDGHRLHVATVDVKVGDPVPLPAVSAVIAGKLAGDAVYAALAWRRDVKDDRTYVYAMLDAPFGAGSMVEIWDYVSSYGSAMPAIDQVIPKPDDAKATVECEAKPMTDALDFAKKLIDKGSGVKVRVNGTVRVSATSADGDAVSEEVEATHEGEAEIGIKPDYLTDAINVKGTVKIGIGDGLSPIRVDARHGSVPVVGVVMPMRL